MKFRALITLFFIMLALVVVNTSWSYYLELYQRDQARNTLSKVRRCLNGYHEGEIIDRLEFCAGGVTTTPTGDIFAFSLKTGQFLYDPSLDCHIEGGKFMTRESLCATHNDPGRCEYAMRDMFLGIDSPPHQRTWWLFDDGREFLEWIIYPEDSIGHNSARKRRRDEPDQILIAIGIQEDELQEAFKPFKVIVFALAFTYMIISLLISTYQRRVEEDGVAGRDT